MDYRWRPDNWTVCGLLQPSLKELFKAKRRSDLQKMGSSTAAQKPKRIMKKLAKCARKLKKNFKTLTRGSNSEMVNYSVSSPHAVTCEELFLPSGVQKGHRRNDNFDHDPFMAAHNAAQNHFTLRPNIYI